jgi:hypothetical protein
MGRILWCSRVGCGNTYEEHAGVRPEACDKCGHAWTVEPIPPPPAPKVGWALSENDCRFLRSLKIAQD